jgi:excinuclease ABC subunit B
MFEIRGEMIDIYSSTEKVVYRLHFSFQTLDHIEIKNAITFEHVRNVPALTVWPATQYLQDQSDLPNILSQIQQDMELRCKAFTDQGKLVEAERLRKRVSYDVKMIQETWFVNGIENYSPYFEQRLSGATPNTIFNYFPDDFLMIIDESHMTLPQLKAMPQADHSRKVSLIEHGFRLPSAIHHRPLSYGELAQTMNWSLPAADQRTDQDPIDPVITKRDAKTLFVSATPSEREISMSEQIVQQVIRPTGLLDPITYIYPKSWNYQILLDSVDMLVTKRPHLRPYLEHLEDHEDVDTKIFG